MKKIDVLDVIDQRISNLKKDLSSKPPGVEKIIIENLINELQYLTWALNNPTDEIYTCTGFKFPYRPK